MPPNDQVPITIKVTCYTKSYGKYIMPVEVVDGSLPGSVLVQVKIADDEIRKFDPRTLNWDDWTQGKIDPTNLFVRCDYFEGTIYIDPELRFMKKRRDPLKVSVNAEDRSSVIVKPSDHAFGKSTALNEYGKRAFRYEFGISNPHGAVKITIP